jgi:hypothetical protein
MIELLRSDAFGIALCFALIPPAIVCAAIVEIRDRRALKKHEASISQGLAVYEIYKIAYGL